MTARTVVPGFPKACAKILKKQESCPTKGELFCFAQLWRAKGQMGLDFEFIPWNHVSLVVKGRQFLLFGDGDSYAKPEYSFGVKVNW